MSLGPTRPSKPEPSITKQPEEKPAPKMDWGLAFNTVLLFVGALLLLGTASGFLGYRSGEKQHLSIATQTVDAYLDAQLRLAAEDYLNHNYILARERLVYILERNPNYQLATELLIEVEVAQAITMTPTPPPPTATPSPTPDMRPAEDQFNTVLSLISQSQWQPALDTLNNLRKNNPEYPHRRSGWADLSVFAKPGD